MSATPPADRPQVRRALFSTWRKEGVAAFATFLSQRGVELLSTGGTARCLREADLFVRDVSEVTGFPEMMDGRVKTLHPHIHGALLFRRDDPRHTATAEHHGILPIDLLVVDLYPFEEASTRKDANFQEVVEMIDIGGPAMVRSAAKNHDHVIVVVDPNDYARVQEELLREDGTTTPSFRRDLAAKAFAHTAAYDATIASWMSPDLFPPQLSLSFTLRAITRYGENPHQAGAVYLDPHRSGGVARAHQLSGKELSYNNFLDASAAHGLVTSWPAPMAAVIKHKNPCGAATASSPQEAFEAAWEGDPLSAFGGILAFNTPVDDDLARAIARPDRFLEVIVAKSFQGDSVRLLTESVKWGKNLRLLEVAPLSHTNPPLEYRSISGGLLVQETDIPNPPDLACVTDRAPNSQEQSSLLLAWEICRHVTSNAIVLVSGNHLVGTGAGQMSRVDAVHQATKKAADRARGSVMASDAFFPFPDGVLAAAAAGVTAVIQPGGSVRDREVIAACNAQNLAMTFTSRRHFRH